MLWPKGLKYIRVVTARAKNKVFKNFKRRKRILSVRCRDNPLERRPKSMQFSRGKRRNKGGRGKANHRREDTSL